MSKSDLILKFVFMLFCFLSVMCMCLFYFIVIMYVFMIWYWELKGLIECFLKELIFVLYFLLWRIRLGLNDIVFFLKFRLISC